MFPIFFQGDKINASDIQLYLGNVGIEFTNKENQDLLDIVPFDGKHFRPCIQFQRILNL